MQDHHRRRHPVDGDEPGVELGARCTLQCQRNLGQAEVGRCVRLGTLRRSHVAPEHPRKEANHAEPGDDREEQLLHRGAG